MSKITPILLAGGAGTRLWPLSRKSYPKQFSPLLGEDSLFQSTANRLSSSEVLSFESIITITNSDFRFIVVEQLQRAGIDPGEVLIEPERRNTAASVLAAALYAQQRNSEATILIAPSDHVIADTLEFHRAIKIGLVEIEKGHIVTFGIKPTRPETGYGYLELVKSTVDKPVAVKRFIEKPDLETVTKMIKGDTYLWNAGIFLARSKDIVQAFETHAPKLLSYVKKSIENGKVDLGFFRLEPESWSRCENISIDYAIMEKLNNISAVPYSSGWNDLGDWEAIWRDLESDEAGVVTGIDATAIDCSNVLLRSENEAQHLVGLGLQDIIAIAMPDAVLVAHKRRSQDVSLVVKKLKNKGIMQAETFPKDHRPWGWFESLVIADRFQVKRILVFPGAALSLQSHHHRSEHWIVVKGTTRVTVNDKVQLLSEGESIRIPLGAIHRMENPGKVPMVLIEVQTGEYLGEDDIVRYEDLYSRV